MTGIPRACCFDQRCPQHRQYDRINRQDRYPVLLPDRRTRGWFARRLETGRAPRYGGRA